MKSNNLKMWECQMHQPMWRPRKRSKNSKWKVILRSKLKIRSKWKSQETSQLKMNLGSPISWAVQLIKNTKCWSWLAMAPMDACRKRNASKLEGRWRLRLWKVKPPWNMKLSNCSERFSWWGAWIIWATSFSKGTLLCRNWLTSSLLPKCRRSVNLATEEASKT